MSTSHVSTETVLRLLRQLPPRERLQVMAQVLPELEHDLPAVGADIDFWQDADMAELIERQSVGPVDDFDALLGGWPADESVDDFLSAVHEWRRQNPVEDAA